MRFPDVIDNQLPTGTDIANPHTCHTRIIDEVNTCVGNSFTDPERLVSSQLTMSQASDITVRYTDADHIALETPATGTGKLLPEKLRHVFKVERFTPSEASDDPVSAQPPLLSPR